MTDDTGIYVLRYTVLYSTVWWQWWEDGDDEDGDDDDDDDDDGDNDDGDNDDGDDDDGDNDGGDGDNDDDDGTMVMMMMMTRWWWWVCVHLGVKIIREGAGDVSAFQEHILTSRCRRLRVWFLRVQ